MLEVWTGFAERIRPGYGVGEAELPAVHAILARLDGLPLAMSLVAPRLAALDHAAILRELEDAGLMTREVEDGPQVKVTYSLTEMGEGLRPAVLALREWACRWQDSLP